MNDLEGYYEEPIMEEEETSISRVEKEIDYKNFLIELAYHEASHFVFDQLILKMNLGFTPVCSMFVHADKENKILEGKVSLLERTNNKSPYAFYKQNPMRLYAFLLVTLAGYTSRLVFIDNDPFFISKTDLKNYTDGKLFYYSLDILPRDVDDVRKTQDYIREFLKIQRNQQKEMITSLVADIELLMEKPAMNLAIRYVKNILIENNGTEIIGQELESVRWKTDILLSKISLEDTISKYL
ncbi:hypothetical protein [Aureispira sp. CCB-E]|uniref:hypothetical protein n=1 Tax=Aureispira sp. CCB-E TaxID=3051121 RepID=UPI0028684B88|nr:hypothetical protein [Aureispira sp. CCB-E]WMX16581.1 hypothetical protein QP953_09395 [Aureispira sp. CCB-E]